MKSNPARSDVFAARLPLAILALAFPALSRAAPVDSQITAATVYADRAVVTREAEVNLAAGENALVFGDLPSALADQSLQVSVHGPAAATILDVSSQQTYVDTTPNPRVRELEDQLLGLAKDDRGLADRIGILNQEKEFVGRMLQSSTAGASGGTEGARNAPEAARPTLEEWQKLYAYSEGALGKIAEEIGSLEDKRTGIAGKKAAVDQQIQLIRGESEKSIKSVKIRITASAAGSFQTKLKYTLPGARWTAAYDARLHSDERTVELSYKGIVQNGTGENWNNIRLTLSTARPGSGGGAPEPRPWTLDIRRPNERMAKSSYEAGQTLAGNRVRTDIADSTGSVTLQPFVVDGAPSPASYEADELSARVQANATSATFEIPQSVTVPADNSAQKVPVTTSTLPASIEYEATPKLAEVAYLRADLVNGTSYPFLAGRVNTFLDDTFVATSVLKTVMPGEKFSVHFGADEGIAVKRRSSRFSENTGLTDGGRRITYDNLITITNHKKSPERVEFKEAIPVSRDEKIVVEMMSPKGEEIGSRADPKEVEREEGGRLVWHIDLKPGEAREVPLKFTVSYPSGTSVTGLE